MVPINVKELKWNMTADSGVMIGRGLSIMGHPMLVLALRADEPTRQSEAVREYTSALKTLLNSLQHLVVMRSAKDSISTSAAFSNEGTMQLHLGELSGDHLPTMAHPDVAGRWLLAGHIVGMPRV